MNILDRKIAEIIINHPGGEDFFNNLDEMIRTDRSILQEAIDLLENYIQSLQKSIRTDLGLILTGAFGQAVINSYSPLEDIVNEIIITNGGLRQEGVKADLLVESVDSNNFILFDDSFYSGTTRDKLELSLKEFNPKAKIIHTVCVYDGGKDDNVTSLYKYYK